MNAKYFFLILFLIRFCTPLASQEYKISVQYKDKGIPFEIGFEDGEIINSDTKGTLVLDEIKFQLYKDKRAKLTLEIPSHRKYLSNNLFSTKKKVAHDKKEKEGHVLHGNEFLFKELFSHDGEVLYLRQKVRQFGL